MITITNDNIYRSDFSVVDMRDPTSLEIIPDDEIIGYLSEEVELGESVTFERMFEIIVDNKEKFNEIYRSCLGGYSLSPFINELDDIPTEKSELDCLEVFWYSDKSDNDITIVSGLHGKGVETSEDGPYKKGDIISYAIDFTPLNNLKYLRIYLNKEVIIMDYDKTGDNSIVKLGNKSFTIFDLFYAILYEISWNGDPTGRKDRLSELEESIEMSEKDIENGKSLPMENLDDFFEQIDNNDKYLVKFKEQRDRVDEELSAHIDDLEPLKNCLLAKLKIYNKIINSKKDLTPYYKKLTDNEYNMQILYGLDEDIKSHKFWETPRCTCPKIDNIVNFPDGGYVFDKECPIHKF